MTILRTVNLNRSYGTRRGIRDVCLDVAEGQILGFLGPNGAGKSTTIRILMGLLRASSGTAEIFGKCCWREGASIRQQVGYVAGDVRLYPWLTLQRGLKLLNQIHGRDVQTQGLALAERFLLEPALPVWKMSRGNRQKVALILALAPQPEMVILDEPTSGLDPLMQDTLMLCLREMAQSGCTILFSSHLLSEVESLCDRIAIIRNGQIVENSRITELRARAPRSITITLHPGQVGPAEWPAVARAIWQPNGGPMNTGATMSSALMSIPPDRLARTCLLEIQGSVMSFLEWACTQGFEDISVSSPSLDALFRGYYANSQGVV